MFTLKHILWDDWAGQHNAWILTFPSLSYHKKVEKLRRIAGGTEIGAPRFSRLLPDEVWASKSWGTWESWDAGHVLGYLVASLLSRHCGIVQCPLGLERCQQRTRLSLGRKKYFPLGPGDWRGWCQDLGKVGRLGLLGPGNRWRGASDLFKMNPLSWLSRTYESSLSLWKHKF